MRPEDPTNVDAIRYANAAGRRSPRTSKRLLVVFIAGFLLLSVCVALIAADPEDEPEAFAATEVTPAAAPAPTRSRDVAAEQATVTAAVEATLQAMVPATPEALPTPTPDVVAMVATVTAEVEAAFRPAVELTVTAGPITIGTTVEAGGSSYTVNEVRDPAPQGRGDVGVGQRVVAVDVTQEGIEDGALYSSLSFFLQDAEGFVYEPLFGYAGVEPSFGTGRLAAGERVRGWVGFHLPAPAVLASVRAKPDFFGSTVLIADLASGGPATPTPTPTLGPDATAAELVAWARDAVVRVAAGSSGGSGFIFAKEGDTAFVVTNYHVIEGARSIDVTVKDSRTYPATLLGFNSDKDVAVLAICCDAGFAVLEWGSGPVPEIGTQVVAIGYPRSAQAGVVATTGEIAGADSITRRYEVLSHTAPLNPGNSGGPLLAMDGLVIGINVGSSTFANEAIYYVVPYGTIVEQVAEWRSRLVITP